MSGQLKPRRVSSNAKNVGHHQRNETNSKISNNSSKSTSSNNGPPQPSHIARGGGSCKTHFACYICSGCSKPIRRDKFLLKACDKYWHENCLKCDRCHSRLGELGSTLYCKSNMNLCRQDYLEMFGKTGVCSVCEKLICASEMVMRAKQNVYHLECFACQLCSQRFCVGDRFYLCENKVVCQYDYEEHILPIQQSMIAEQTADSIYATSTITSQDTTQAPGTIQLQTIQFEAGNKGSILIDQRNPGCSLLEPEGELQACRELSNDNLKAPTTITTSTGMSIREEGEAGVSGKGETMEVAGGSCGEPEVENTAGIKDMDEKLELSGCETKEEDYFQLNKDEMETKTKYIGCIGVKESMRRLSHLRRSEVAKESIIRLCEANNIEKKTEKKRSDEIRGMLEDKPNLTNSGVDVQLCVTSMHLNVISRDTQQIIVQHEMPNVSFASSGDEDTVDFVAYVAKDAKFGRACFVLECGHETAKSVLENIAQGFQLRSQQIRRCTLSRNSSSVNQDRIPNSNDSLRLTETHDNSYDQSYRINNENQHGNDILAITRASLEREPWYHGSYVSREDSEGRLKQDGDFLVRESMLNEGHFVLSVMHDGVKLHLLFDSIGQVRTKEMVFNNISHLVKYHHDEGSPIVADRRIVYLLNGVRPIH